MEDTTWKRKEALWISFLNTESVSRDLIREFLSGYLIEHGFQIESSKGPKLTAIHRGEKGNRYVWGAIGFNDKGERMLHVKCKDETTPNSLEFFQVLLDDFGEHLAANKMLRGQKFNPKGPKLPYKSRIKEREALSTETYITNLLSQNCRFAEQSNLFVIFLSNRIPREEVKELFVEYAGNMGLTSKYEGQAVIRSANSTLCVEAKIGFNPSNERILSLTNQISFIGGDTKGKIFREFSLGFARKLIAEMGLKDQDEEDLGTEDISFEPMVGQTEDEVPQDVPPRLSKEIADVKRLEDEMAEISLQSEEI